MSHNALAYDALVHALLNGREQSDSAEEEDALLLALDNAWQRLTPDEQAAANARLAGIS